MNTLNPFTIPLESINLIEASAGTGKSWTVTLLYLRLILEKGLTVDQILVVTFTDAATKELRDDMRHRLVEALTAFEDEDYQKDDEYFALIQNITDRAEAVRALNRAKLSLDEASIFTIHSFCQRSLTDNAFEAGLPFQSELISDDRELMQRITDDFWRRNFYKAPPALLFKLKQKSITPDSLLSDIYTAVGKPYLKLCGPLTEELDHEKWHELQSLFTDAVSCWRDNKDEVVALLENPALDDAYLVTFKKSREFCIKTMGKYTYSNNLPSSLDSKLNWLGTKAKTKKNFETLEHSFFQKWQLFLDCWSELDEKSEDSINLIRIQLLRYLQKEHPKEKYRLGVLSFDDLLLQLQQSLRSNPQLADGIRQKYKAALIDEFQDTDPIQYEIFSKIFSSNATHQSTKQAKSTSQANNKSHTVFLVGDPKQAIYSFRGGDIHTYLKAKSETPRDNHYTLKTNWRSHPELISAFNSLYSAVDNPFQDQGIDYIEVEAGTMVNDELITIDNRKPLRFWQLDTESEKKISAPILRKEIAEAVAGDIAELLNAAQSGKAKIGDKDITGGDIAILIRSHTQGDLIKQALSARGIASVQSSNESIFQTHEAVELLRLLTAITEPQREDNVRAALVTELMGYQANALINFEENSDSWEDKLLQMQNWHFLWEKKGLLPMMRDLMQAEKMHQHLLSFDNGERRLTNILHLAELAHKQSRQQSLSMKEVLRWLQQQQLNSSENEAELRLESDEKLVKIVTIHKSKGLEYPIVYCPFVGISNKPMAKNIFIFHKDEEACLEIGSSEAKDNKAIKAEEERAEDTRLLYVALTRAKYQCTVVCVPEPISGTPDRTALGWLLTDGKSLKTGSTKAIKADNEVFFQQYVERLQVLSNHQAIEVLDLPTFDRQLRYQTIEPEVQLTARQFTAEIKHQAQMTSFSGLTAGAHSERPDFDTDATPAIPTAPIQSHSNSNDDQQQLEAFPRGATAGVALHEIYENLDFVKPVEEQTEITSSILNKWAFDPKYENVANTLIDNSLKTELSESLSLNQITSKKRLDEMEFYLPLNQLHIDDLKQLLFQHLPVEWQTVRNAVNTLYFEQVEGYLKGFIDLIFEHDGLYYLADYKSNSLNDYHQGSLLQTMADSHYYLQLLIYNVALHRYLQKRVTDYSWDTHIGGAYYLFIRGMGKNTKNEGGGSINQDDGVFFYKPDKALIDAMDSLFMESLI